MIVTTDELAVTRMQLVRLCCCSRPATVQPVSSGHTQDKGGGNLRRNTASFELGRGRRGDSGRD